MAEGVFWDKPAETAPVKDLKKMQLKLLKSQLERVYRGSRFYRMRFERGGFHPSDIKSLEDVRKIPFATREDLEKNFQNILSVPRSEVATIRMTSGTTGKPLTIAHTKKDIENIAEASARKLSFHGVTCKDVVQVTASYGLWQGGWSAHWGAEKIGAFILPIGPGDTERQIRVIRGFKTTVLYGVTNYHFRIAEVAKQLGVDLRDFSLRVGICVAEKPTKSQIEELKEEFGYDLVAIDYGATEFPGFSVHCSADPDFHHVWSDFYLIEVVDPETHENLGEGERGELVVTSLQREAFPLVRYLSRDVTKYIGFEECDCGLTHSKIGVEIDREDFMAKIRGTSVFPSQIECMLKRFSVLTGRSQIIVNKRTPKQEVTLKLEEARVEETISKMMKKSIKEEIQCEIKARIGVSINNVVFVPFGAFENKYEKTVVIS